MGGSSFSYSDWDSKKTTYTSKSTSSIFSSSKLSTDLDPSKMKNMCRESCDSDANPESTPIIIGLDCTGSMGMIPDNLIREGLGELFNEIYTRKPVSDPHVLFAAFGDVVAGDPGPLQIGQFEAGVDELTSTLEKIWLNGCHGGGNDQESADLIYYFAANMTKHDSFLKRGKKGFIFTISDEPTGEVLKPDHIEKLFGFRPESDAHLEDIMAQVRRTYEPFHIIIEEGSHVRHHGLDAVYTPWKRLLGENVILCSDYRKLPEIITSILQVKSGVDKKSVSSSWDGSTSLVVDRAISGLSVIAKDEGLVF